MWLTMCALLSQASGVRKERDTFGELEVPADRYWGAQTARSKMNFEIGGETERMPVCSPTHTVTLQLHVRRKCWAFFLSQGLVNTWGLSFIRLDLCWSC